MGNTLTISGEHVAALTREPDLYRVVSFLAPLREGALAAHAQFGKACKPCYRSQWARFIQSLGSAFGQLVVKEYAKTDHGELPRLREVMLRILKLPADISLRLSYQVGTEKRDLLF